MILLVILQSSLHRAFSLKIYFIRLWLCIFDLVNEDFNYRKICLTIKNEFYIEEISVFF